MSGSGAEQLLAGFDDWYASQCERTSVPSKGVLAAALQVLDDLRGVCDLRVEAHLTENQGQVRGLSGERLRAILERYGVYRVFLKEGGRTSRGVMGPIRRLLTALDSATMGALPLDCRLQAIDRMQDRLVDGVRQHMGKEKLKFTYNPTKSTYASVVALLEAARQKECYGPVAEYLVGAKLQLRFPETPVRNSSYSTSDDQSGEPGDFRVGATAFHVTVSPLPGVYNKCRGNAEAGLRAYLIVPEHVVVGARQNAQLTAPDMIAVCSLESFVAGNVDELASFDMPAGQFRRLLELYNERVAEVETDQALLIEIPGSL